MNIYGKESLKYLILASWKKWKLVYSTNQLSFIIFTICKINL